MLRKRDGFTLVEVTVSIGILGGVAIAIMTLVEMMHRSAKKIDDDFAIMSTMQEMNRLFSDRDACGANFQTLDFSRTNTNAITEVKNKNGTTKLKLGPVPAAGQLQITSINVTLTNPGGKIHEGNDNTFDINFTFARATKSVPITRTVKATVEYAANHTFRGCYSSFIAFDSNALYSEICETGLKGTYDHTRGCLFKYNDNYYTLQEALNMMDLTSRTLAAQSDKLLKNIKNPAKIAVAKGSACSAAAYCTQVGGVLTGGKCKL
jgi:type II secretory pathway pseudopilin PulG